MGPGLLGYLEYHLAGLQNRRGTAKVRPKQALIEAPAERRDGWSADNAQGYPRCLVPTSTSHCGNGTGAAMARSSALSRAPELGRGYEINDLIALQVLESLFVGSHFGLRILNFAPKKAIECENLDERYSRD